MLALPTRSEALTYLLAFGGGTVLSMAAFSWGMGFLALRCQNSAKIYRGLMSACAIAAMAIGCLWFTGKSW